MGSALLLRWKTDRALQRDTRVIVSQASQQLVRALESRRGTLTLLRDTFDKAPNLLTDERRAMAKSGVEHTRHLLALGQLRRDQPIVWLTDAPALTDAQFGALQRALAQRVQLRMVWRLSSTLTSQPTERPILIMLEPMRAKGLPPSVLVGVFDVHPLLTDFFELSLQQPFPVQVLDGDTILYRSPRWSTATDAHAAAVIEQPIQLDAVRWHLQMQPGTTHVARTITWYQGLLVCLCFVAGISAIALIWLLTMRTWILEQAVSRRTAALRRTSERLRQLAITDELTGLYNRRFFHRRWQWECERARRYQRPLVCLMIDVNGFKRINDVLGHRAGDAVLAQVSETLRAQLRQSDMLARYGGDEFIIALPETTFEQAVVVAEKLRSLAIEGPWSAGGVGSVTLSVGVSRLEPHESPEQVIQHADEDLYASRHAARQASSTVASRA